MKEYSVRPYSSVLSDTSDKLSAGSTMLLVNDLLNMARRLVNKYKGELVERLNYSVVEIVPMSIGMSTINKPFQVL